MNHLRFLKYIDEIAKTGSIRRAALKLHVAPSAVNRRLQDIEAELDTLIFERLPKGMRLTAQGEIFIDYIRARNADLEQVKSEIEDLKGLQKGTIKLAVSQALAANFLPSKIQDFLKIYPSLHFEVFVGDHVQAIRRLRDFESDVALSFNFEPSNDIEILSQVEQKLMAVMHRKHPLAKNKEGLKLKDVTPYPLALPNKDTGGRQMLERFMLKNSMVLNPQIESNNFEFLRNCLFDEKTITFQIAIGAASDHQHLVAKYITDRGFSTGTLSVVKLAARKLPIGIGQFINHMKNDLV